MAKTEWRIEGRVQVLDNLTTFRFGDNMQDPLAGAGTDGPAIARPLANIRVRVSAKREVNDPSFAKWEEGRTDNEGRFNIQTMQRDVGSWILVEVRFDNDDLAVMDARGADTRRESPWIVIFRDGAPIPPQGRSRNVGDVAFGDVNATQAGVRDEDERKRAVFWVAAKGYIDILRRQNPGGTFLAFKGKVTVVFPAPTVGDASYATHITKRMVHVDPSRLNGGMLILTLLHEMSHIWNYDHNKGWTRWPNSMLSVRHGYDMDTANKQEWPAIAFHEGFAEYAGWELYHELFGLPHLRPYRRAFFAQHARTGLKSLAEAQNNWLAAMNGLLYLTLPNLDHYRLGSATDPGGTSITAAKATPILGAPASRRFPGMSVFDVMRIFEGRPGTPFPDDWGVGHRNVGLFDFYDRVEALSLGRLDTDTKLLLLELLDPNSTREPVTMGPVPPDRRPPQR